MPLQSSARVDPDEQNPGLSPPPSNGEGVEDAPTGLLLPAVRHGRIQEASRAARASDEIVYCSIFIDLATRHRITLATSAGAADGT